VKLTRIIRPAKAITPSITKTLNKDRISMSDNITEERDRETRKRMKKVIISNKRRVINNHSENIRKATDKKSQITSTIAAKNGKGLEEQSTGM